MNHFFIYIDVKYFKGVFMNMFCKIGITSAICAAALFTGCSDDSSSGTPVTAGMDEAGWREQCLEIINEYRATEGVAPLELADEDVQWCTVQQAKADAEVDKAHANSRMCGIGAQNTGPHFSTTWKKNASSAVRSFIKMMWDDEKALVTSGERDPNKDEDYTYIGHYLNMRNSAYTKLSCGIALTEDGKKAWFNMNFYR